MAKNPNELGALWVTEPKSDRSPVLTGEINGQRVALFKNRMWKEEDKKKLPLYHVWQSKAQSKAKED